MKKKYIVRRKKLNKKYIVRRKKPKKKRSRACARHDYALKCECLGKKHEKP